MSVRAVFFDMDDTLLDGASAMEAAWAVVCADAVAGNGHDPEQLREAIRRESLAFWANEAAVAHMRLRLHDAREEIVRRALLSEGLDPGPAHTMAGRYLDEHLARLGPFDDAFPTLEALRESGMRLAILTNGPADFQRAKVVKHGFEPAVDLVVIEGEFGAGKPDRRVFAHALEQTGVAAEEAWMVGDNLHADVDGANAAGIHSVWITRDRLTMPENPPGTPERTISDLYDLLAALRLVAPGI